MRRLGEILLEKGAIAVSELHTGLDACRRSGGRLGTQLLRFGFVDEAALLRALSEQYGVPSVPSTIIAKSALAVRRSVPLGVLKRLQTVPFDQAPGGLRVAMINPRDPVAIDELTQHVGGAIEPFVATEPAVAEALAEIDDELVQVTTGPSIPAGDDGLPAVDDWLTLWQPPHCQPSALLGPVQRLQGARPRLHVATYPGLGRVDGVADGDHNLDEASFIAGLQEARHRDDIGGLLLRFAVGFLPRCALFMVHKGQIAGWMARGEAVVIDDVQTFGADVDEPCIMRSAILRGESITGGLADSGPDVQLAEVMGDPAPLDVLAMPVRVKDRTVAVLVGDMPGEAVLAVPVRELSMAAARAGVALEMLIMRHKIAS